VRLVFTTTRRNALNRATFDEKSWRPAVVAAGMVPTRATGMHSLRHFYASALLDAVESIRRCRSTSVTPTRASRSGRTRI
jgi:hypothetical protein